MTTEEQIERLEEATTAANDALRDLNAAGKDLRNTLKEAREFVEAGVAGLIEAEIEKQFGSLRPVTEQHLRAYVEGVIAEIGKMNDAMGLDQVARLSTVRMAGLEAGLRDGIRTGLREGKKRPRP